MADWPIWVWILIAVVAVVIIVAIIFGTRRTDEIDEGGPFAEEQHPGNDSLTPRRGTTDPAADVAPEELEPVTPSRAADIDEDEETLTGPLAVPDDAAGSPDGPRAEEAPFASETVEDFAPHEPVVAQPEGMASQDPQSHLEAPAADAVDPEVIAEEGGAVEAQPETAPAPATEEPTPEPVAQSPADDDPPEHDFAPPKHTAEADYGAPVDEVEVDDDVPRDDLGRRLDPYGNPVD